MTAYYSTGTVSIGAGSTTLTGAGTAWTTAGLRPGDKLILAGLSVPIASVNSATQITLARAWPGAAQTAQNYHLQYIFDDARALTATNLLLQALGSGTLTSLSGLAGAANLMPYWTGAGVMATTALTAAARSLLDDADAAAMRATLGLGTAATLTATTSSSDTTAGRVTRVGDGGLLGTMPISSGSNLFPSRNLPTGFWAFSTSAVEQHPEGGAAWAHGAIVLQPSLATTGGVKRTAYLSGRLTGGATAQRLWWGVDSSVENEIVWSEIITNRRLVGTVSQSAGLPTGTVLESGSNANGEFIRMADGRQICTRSMAASSSAAVTWTFPAAFVAAPVVSGTAVATVQSVVCLDAAPFATTASFSARDTANARRADTVHLIAVGRWF
jgi:hypothetical protein